MIPDITVYGDVTLVDLLVVIVTMVVAVIVAKAVTLNLRKTLSDKLRKDELEMLIRIAYAVIIGVAIISVLPVLGLNLSGLLVAGGIAGIVIGFASQSVVSNFISGLFLMTERPIKIGDAVKIGDVSGIVEDVHVMSTIIRTFDGVYVRMPNESVFTSNIMNYMANVARRFEYVVGIRYSDDAEKAIQIIQEIIDEHPLTLVNPPPQIFVDNLGDNAVNIIVRIWAPSTQWYPVKMELLWKIKKTLEENGIEIPFPQRTIWFGKEEKKMEEEVKEVAEAEIPAEVEDQD
ncbi:MAG TPA: mechanosensitive ion channel family protein [Archaeoglobaceae archaeon]|nr:mechanosensitive ion channel family protein [Archaeoglobaceae archaeon]